MSEFKPRDVSTKPYAGGLGSTWAKVGSRAPQLIHGSPPGQKPGTSGLRQRWVSSVCCRWIQLTDGPSIVAGRRVKVFQQEVGMDGQQRLGGRADWN